jgi:hypothetical protein
MDAILVHGFGKSGSSKLELSNLGERSGGLTYQEPLLLGRFWRDAWLWS